MAAAPADQPYGPGQYLNTGKEHAPVPRKQPEMLEGRWRKPGKASTDFNAPKFKKTKAGS